MELLGPICLPEGKAKFTKRAFAELDEWIENGTVIYAGNLKRSGNPAAVADTTELEVHLDGRSLGCLPVPVTGDMHTFSSAGTWNMALAEGEHIVDVVIRDKIGTQAANVGAICFAFETDR